MFNIRFIKNIFNSRCGKGCISNYVANIVMGLVVGFEFKLSSERSRMWSRRGGVWRWEYNKFLMSSLDGGGGRESRVKLSRNRNQFPTSSILLSLPLPPSKLPIRETALGLGLGFVIFFWRKRSFRPYILGLFLFGPYISILPLLVPNPINACYFSLLRHSTNRKSWRDKRSALLTQYMLTWRIK